MAEALALEEALAVSSREAALLEQREALDVQLAIDASMMDITWRKRPNEMLPQLQWLRQPASLLRLLQRPVLLDAWLRGEEEEHASIPRNFSTIFLEGSRSELKTKFGSDAARLNLCHGGWHLQTTQCPLGHCRRPTTTARTGRRAVEHGFAHAQL